MTASIRAAATKVLGSGTRYTVVIKGQEKYLFEEAGRWFVEAVIKLFKDILKSNLMLNPLNLRTGTKRKYGYVSTNWVGAT